MGWTFQKSGIPPGRSRLELITWLGTQPRRTWRKNVRGVRARSSAGLRSLEIGTLNLPLHWPAPWSEWSYQRPELMTPRSRVSQINFDMSGRLGLLYVIKWPLLTLGCPDIVTVCVRRTWPHTPKQIELQTPLKLESCCARRSALNFRITRTARQSTLKTWLVSSLKWESQG